MTPAGELSAAVEVLTAAGVSSPRADAEWLLAHALGTERGRLLLVDEVDQRSATAFRELIARRADREPLQHIIGRVEFGAGNARVDLRVGPGVFIPRPETELLLEWAIGAAPPGALIADLCAGSGALALGLATARADVRVVAVEKFDEARAWLRRNVAAQPLGVAHRVAVVAADVTDPAHLRADFAAQAGPLGWPSTSFDLIVSNPPYVPTVTAGAATEVSAEVRADPADAVFAGPDGMSVIVPMLAAMGELGKPGSAVGIEHDDATAPAVAAALTAAGFTSIQPCTDLTGAPRYVTAVQARRISAVQG